MAEKDDQNAQERREESEKSNSIVPSASLPPRSEEQHPCTMKDVRHAQTANDTVITGQESDPIQSGESHVLEKAGGTESASREEVDARSIFVGNVDYTCMEEDIAQHFQTCGTVNRVTIFRDRYGSVKGHAYVEFSKKEDVENALSLHKSILCDREIKVGKKRTNIPGMLRLQRERFKPPMGYRQKYLSQTAGNRWAPRLRRSFRYNPF